MPSYAAPDASQAGAAPILSDAAFVHAVESDALVFKPLDAIQATVPYAPSNGASQPTVFPEPFAAADIFASPGLDPSGHPLQAYNSVLHDAPAPSATQAAATQAHALGESPGLDRFGTPAASVQFGALRHPRRDAGRVGRHPLVHLTAPAASLA
jgi:hypothetical protein